MQIVKPQRSLALSAREPFPKLNPKDLQQVYGVFGEEVHHMQLPPANSEVLPGIRWGEPGEVFCPGFWAHQVWLSGITESTTYNIGETLVEEIASCMLGGYGFRSELGLAAFDKLKQEGLLVPRKLDARIIEEILAQPIPLGAKMLRYRFPKQKARYLAGALSILAEHQPPLDQGGRALRNWLLQLPGIGLKTAGWVARNWLKSNEVAIIDIHIFRAGLLAGIFSPDQRIQRDYLDLEDRFIRFAQALDIPASALDSVMWEQMREFGSYAIKTLKARIQNLYKIYPNVITG